MTTPHPEAEKLVAIAQGKQMQCQDKINEGWYTITGDVALSVICKGAGSLVRIAPETILVNGVECAKNVEHVLGKALWSLDICGGRILSNIFWFETKEQRDQAEAATILPFQS